MKQNKSAVITVITLVTVLLVVGIFTFTLRGNTGESVGSEATRSLSSTLEDSYTDLEGNPLSLDSYKGKVRIVNSWASWCPFCVKELTNFQKLAEEYISNDVVVIAINRKESTTRAKNFIQTLGSLDNIVFVQDSGDIFYQSIGGFSMPETVFYDKKGNVSTHKRGFLTFEEMKKLTEKAINATGVQ